MEETGQGDDSVKEKKELSSNQHIMAFQNNTIHIGI